MTCAERIPAALLALLLLAACSGASSEAPRPLGVQPARGVNQQPTPVRISGEGFRAVAVRRLSGSTPVEVDASFSAALGEVALEQVLWRGAEQLEAVVPAGLAPGLYTLSVRGPLGETGTLQGAFQVYDAPFAQLTVDATPGSAALAPGQETELLATFANGGDAPLRELDAALVQEGEGRVEVLSAAATQASLAAGGSASRSWRVRALTPGEVRLSVEAHGVDAESGLAVQARSAPAPLRVLGPSVLASALTLEPLTLNIGATMAVSLTLTNTGERRAVDVQPELPSVEGAAQLVRLSGPDAAGFALEAGQQRTVRYTLRALSAGDAQLRVGASARDEASGTVLSAPEASEPFTVLVPATLSGSFVMPASVSVGQDFPLHVDVSNSGQSAAQGLQVQATVASSGSALQLLTPAPVAQDVPGGVVRRFSWTVRALASGRPTLRVTGSAVDATSGAAVSLAAGPSAELPVQRAAALGASLAVPAAPLVIGDTFEVALTVRNDGEAEALDVGPSALTPSVSGLVQQLTAPGGVVGSLPAGAQTVFRWSLRAESTGTLGFGASASGRDANSGATVVSPGASSAATRIGRVRELAVNPFADGTDFSFLASFGGRVLLGPSRTGSGAVSMLPDGSAPLSLGFSLSKDSNSTGNTSDNSQPGPFPSIGSTGCARDTTACGPDNEDGRGVFFSGLVGATEFLGVAGGRSGGDWSYVYLTRDTASPLRFSYVDLRNAPPGPATRGISSARFVGGPLYLGLPDTGGSRPYFIRLRSFPSGQGGGLDALAGTDALNLELDRAPGFGESGSPKNPASTVGVDAIGDFAQLLYVANNGSWLRSTVAEPRAYPVAPGDWKLITPSAAAYAAHVSVQLPGSADLLPSDKAVPFFAVLQGRLYAARNTLAGPQLWVCNPGVSAPLADCDAADWSLLAPNTSGTLTLSQFNTAANTRVTLLAASATRLYVGFDDAGGAVVYRSSGSAPVAAADFEGEGGCPAALGAGSCPGLGGNGLGGGAQRLYDNLVLSSAGRDFVYLTAGTSGAPVRVYRISE